MLMAGLLPPPAAFSPAPAAFSASWRWLWRWDRLRQPASTSPPPITCHCRALSARVASPSWARSIAQCGLEKGGTAPSSAAPALGACKGILDAKEQLLTTLTLLTVKAVNPTFFHILSRRAQRSKSPKDRVQFFLAHRYFGQRGENGVAGHRAGGQQGRHDLQVLLSADAELDGSHILGGQGAPIRGQEASPR